MCMVGLIVSGCGFISETSDSETIVPASPTTAFPAETVETQPPDTASTRTTVDVSNVPVLPCGSDGPVPASELAHLKGRPVEEAIAFAEQKGLRPVVFLPDALRALEPDYSRISINATADCRITALACNG